MRKLLFASVSALGMAFAFGAEGDIGTQAYQWANYSDLNPTTPTLYSLSNYSGKVVLLNLFQYNCAGCDANAPAIGQLADSLGSGLSTSHFQGVGAEIDNGTYAQIQASYVPQLKKDSATFKNPFNYPLVHVPYDTAITVIGSAGENWHRYNSYRDVYFVIDATGKIVARVAGNRLSVMPADSLAKIKNAIATALASVPTSILCLNSCGQNGLKASRQEGGFHFNLNSSSGPVLVQILDLQGRMMRSFSIQPAASGATWNGLDAHGNAIPYGTYFLKATGSGISQSQRINWLP